jgi:hypothetical protein
LAFLLSSIFDTCPAHFILLDSINRIIFRADFRPLSSLCYSLFHSSVSWSRFGHIILLSTQFSSTLNLFLHCSLRSYCWSEKLI